MHTTSVPLVAAVLQHPPRGAHMPEKACCILAVLCASTSPLLIAAVCRRHMKYHTRDKGC